MGTPPKTAESSAGSTTPQRTATPTPMSSDSPEPSAPVRISGKFQKGQSGNPAGRSKGSRNSITLRRLETEEAMRNMLAPNAKRVLQRALDIALKGDPEAPSTVAMIKLILDKTLSTLKNEDVGESRDTAVNVTIQQLTQNTGSAPPSNVKQVEARIVPQNQNDR